MGTSEGRSPRELTTGGITLLGVLLSIGLTVALGISGAWWVRVLAGGASTVALVAVVKLTTASGWGPLARAANWVIGLPERGRD